MKWLKKRRLEKELKNIHELIPISDHQTHHHLLSFDDLIDLVVVVR